MGWSITLTSHKKEITVDEVSEIVATLPPHLTIPLLCDENGIPKLNDWGWSAATDIHYPVENHLMISGSYGMSSQKSKEMADFLMSELVHRGHVITEERIS